MSNSSITLSKRKNKQLNPALFPVAAGVILVICLVFFFCTLSDISKSKSEPEVFDIQTVSATDTSLLLSWNCTPAAEKYSVRCVSTDGENIAELITETPFAVFRKLSPDTKYTIEVSALKNSTEYPPCSASASTEAHCAVTSVNVKKTTPCSVTISWEYTGKNNGFTAVAYVVDIHGKRHLTSDEVKIAKGKNTECTIEGLMPDTKYTVAVIPNTKFKQADKAQFTTEYKKISYDKLTIVRSVICSADTDDSPNVLMLTTVSPDTKYKISMIIKGKAAKDDTADMALYIKDKDGNLVSETNFGAVRTNPDGSESYKHRVILLSFTSPSNTGEYDAYITIDGEIAAQLIFETAD